MKERKAGENVVKDSPVMVWIWIEISSVAETQIVFILIVCEKFWETANQEIGSGIQETVLVAKQLCTLEVMSHLWCYLIVS